MKTFKEWHKECDNLLVNDYGVGVDDLEDWLWMDAFDDDLPPEEAVAAFKEDNGYTA